MSANLRQQLLVVAGRWSKFMDTSSCGRSVCSASSGNLRAEHPRLAFTLTAGRSLVREGDVLPVIPA